MKLVQLFAIAGFAATGLVGATAAQAQDWRYGDRHDSGWERDRHDRHDRGDRHARWDRHRGWDRGEHRGWNHAGYGYRSRTVCWDERRHGRRVEVCRRR